MNPLTMIWTDVRVLAVNTTRVWWRLLPQLLAIHMLGWLSYQVSLRVASIVADINPWPSLVIFSLGFVGQLAAIVISLRVIGKELGIRQLLPEGESQDDDRDASVSRMLALTLLPFLGIYAAFGYIQEASDQLAIETIIRQGVLGDTITSTLAFSGLQGNLILGGIIVGTYLLRRGLDLLHDKTDWRIVGVLVAVTETFFILTVVLSGQRLLNRVRSWILDRQLVGWLANLREQVAGFFAQFKIDLPEILDGAWVFLQDQVWPSFWEIVSEPIVWLAIVALIYGSRITSIAELTRKRRAKAARLEAISRQERRRRRINASEGAQRAFLEFAEAFLGDVDDKYLPTIHSLRLVLRAGVIFLGAYILVYAVQDILENYLRIFTTTLIGGHPIDFWIVTGTLWDLVYSLPFEPWRLCLLAVGFQRCLYLLRARANASATAAEPQPQTEQVSA